MSRFQENGEWWYGVSGADMLARWPAGQQSANTCWAASLAAVSGESQISFQLMTSLESSTHGITDGDLNKLVQSYVLALLHVGLETAWLWKHWNPICPV